MPPSFYLHFNIMSQSKDRVALPGFGLPIDSMPRPKKRFPHAIADDFAKFERGVMVSELRMLDFMNQISDKPEWDRKVFDKATNIVAKWEEEACSEERGAARLSTAMFIFVSSVC